MTQFEVTGSTLVTANYTVVLKGTVQGNPPAGVLSVNGGKSSMVLVDGVEYVKGKKVKVGGKEVELRVFVEEDLDLPAMLMLDGEVLRGVKFNMME